MLPFEGISPAHLGRTLIAVFHGLANFCFMWIFGVKLVVERFTIVAIVTSLLIVLVYSKSSQHFIKYQLDITI